MGARKLITLHKAEFKMRLTGVLVVCTLHVKYSVHLSPNFMCNDPLKWNTTQIVARV